METSEITKKKKILLKTVFKLLMRLARREAPQLGREQIFTIH